MFSSSINLSNDVFDCFMEGKLVNVYLCFYKLLFSDINCIYHLIYCSQSNNAWIINTFINVGWIKYFNKKWSICNLLLKYIYYKNTCTLYLCYYMCLTVIWVNLKVIYDNVFEAALFFHIIGKLVLKVYLL